MEEKWKGRSKPRQASLLEQRSASKNGLLFELTNMESQSGTMSGRSIRDCTNKGD
jgi:hypothetical protein